MSCFGSSEFFSTGYSQKDSLSDACLRYSVHASCSSAQNIELL